MDVKQIVGYMVEHGTESTHYGSWIFGLEDDLVLFSEMPVKWLLEHKDEIYDELLGREEVADVDDYEENGVHRFSIYFYTGFCPNLRINLSTRKILDALWKD